MTALDILSDQSHLSLGSKRNSGANEIKSQHLGVNSTKVNTLEQQFSGERDNQISNTASLVFF